MNLLKFAGSRILPPSPSKSAELELELDPVMPGTRTLKR